MGKLHSNILVSRYWMSVAHLFGLGVELYAYEVC